jgi:hypothetical protein
MEPETFRLVALCQNQLRYRMPPKLDKGQHNQSDFREVVVNYFKLFLWRPSRESESNASIFGESSQQISIEISGG